MPRTLLAAACSLAALVGCASAPPEVLDPGATSIPIPAGEYSRALDAARDALRSRRFRIDRVDAGAGVVTTAPLPAAGLAVPWDRQQIGLDREFEDLLTSQARRARVVFEPVAVPPSLAADPPATSAPQAPGDPPPTAAPAASPAPDLRDHAGPLTAHVEVLVERLHRPGRRVETAAVRFSSRSRDESLAARRMHPAYAVPYARDPRLEAALAADIHRRLGIAPAPSPVRRTPIPDPAQ